MLRIERPRHISNKFMTPEKILEKANEFFNLVDNYLIKDLNTMIIEIESREFGGGVGYPAIHSVVSGMELMGLILSGKQYDAAFDVFWNDYLEKEFPEYKKTGLKDIFRKVIRNGTAHYFLVKASISISKNNMNHLQNIDGFLNIDLKVLLSHFLKCYQSIKEDVLSKKTKLDNFDKGFKELSRQMVLAQSMVHNFLGDDSFSKLDFDGRSIKKVSGGASGVCFDVPKTDPPDYWLNNK